MKAVSFKTKVVDDHLNKTLSNQFYVIGLSKKFATYNYKHSLGIFHFIY